MKPLFVLLIVFVLTLAVTKLVNQQWDFILAGNMAMCMMLCFTALGHFKFTKGMSMMIPAFIPCKKELVYLTGIIEILAGIALLFPPYRHASAVFLLLFFIIMLPANIYAAVKHVDYEKANNEGSGINYLWFRVPLQLLFIAWVWYFGIAHS